MIARSNRMENDLREPNYATKTIIIFVLAAAILAYQTLLLCTQENNESTASKKRSIRVTHFSTLRNDTILLQFYQQLISINPCKSLGLSFFLCNAAYAQSRGPLIKDLAQF
jgi:hypothetical protein